MLLTPPRHGLLEDLDQLRVDLDAAQASILAAIEDADRDAGELITTVAQQNHLDEAVVQVALWELIHSRQVTLTPEYAIHSEP